MKAQNAKALAVASLVVALAAWTPMAYASLLVDPGFENNALTTAANVLSNFTTYQGQWGVEAATITGVDGGVTPAQGVRMLRMVSDGLVATQAFQATNVTSFAGPIDAGAATVNLGALFNVGTPVPAAAASVAIRFFSAANWGSAIGTPIFSGMGLDNNSQSWEFIGLNSIPVPVGTRWLITELLYVNSTLVGQPGYVDAARLDLVPEPSSLALCGLAGLLTLAHRRRRRS